MTALRVLWCLAFHRDEYGQRSVRGVGRDGQKTGLLVKSEQTGSTWRCFWCGAGFEDLREARVLKLFEWERGVSPGYMAKLGARLAREQQRAKEESEAAKQRRPLRGLRMVEVARFTA